MLKIIQLEAKELQTFGDNEIWDLGEFYLKNQDYHSLEREMLLLEWSYLKLRLYASKNLIKGDILAYILTESYFQVGFEGLMILLRIFAALPSSNAEVARGFSCMNRTKTHLRNKLSIGKLEYLMMISLNGEDYKTWSPNESYVHWKMSNTLRNVNE